MGYFSQLDTELNEVKRLEQMFQRIQECKYGVRIFVGECALFMLGV